jgi:hypothetical protein
MSCLQKNSRRTQAAAWTHLSSAGSRRRCRMHAGQQQQQLGKQDNQLRQVYRLDTPCKLQVAICGSCCSTQRVREPM